ncbi:YfbM family protein [Kitasatospora sp. NPDC051853]|uniref:YfbM family protein n=1 Tax=Kitasatospora sp. NPDC051853 TaxID=3364058 RepID=UPI0037AF4D24
MSMNGAYLRVTPGELAQVLEDPEWAWGFANDIQEHEEEAVLEPDSARYFSTERAWDLLGFLLRRSGFPVDVVQGEEPVPGAGDWGYGPPQYLTVEQVREASDGLGRLTYDELIADVARVELAAAEIYPQITDTAALDWAREAFAPLVEFFRSAAYAGHAVVVWID